MQALTPTDQVDFSRRYTLEEFWDLPEPENGAHYDLIEGYLYLVPPHDPFYQKLVANMTAALSKFLTDNKIDGEIHSKEPICRGDEGSTHLEPELR